MPLKPQLVQLEDSLKVMLLKAREAADDLRRVWQGRLKRLTPSSAAEEALLLKRDQSVQADLLTVYYVSESDGHSLNELPTPTQVLQTRHKRIRTEPNIDFERSSERPTSIEDSAKIRRNLRSRFKKAAGHFEVLNERPVLKNNLSWQIDTVQIPEEAKQRKSPQEPPLKLLKPQMAIFEERRSFEPSIKIEIPQGLKASSPTRIIDSRDRPRSTAPVERIAMLDSTGDQRQRSVQKIQQSQVQNLSINSRSDALRNPRTSADQMIQIEIPPKSYRVDLRHSEPSGDITLNNIEDQRLELELEIERFRHLCASHNIFYPCYDILYEEKLPLGNSSTNYKLKRLALEERFISDCLMADPAMMALRDLIKVPERSGSKSLPYLLKSLKHMLRLYIQSHTSPSHIRKVLLSAAKQSSSGNLSTALATINDELTKLRAQNNKHGDLFQLYSKRQNIKGAVQDKSNMKPNLLNPQTFAVLSSVEHATLVEIDGDITRIANSLSKSSCDMPAYWGLSIQELVELDLWEVQCLNRLRKLNYSPVMSPSRNRFASHVYSPETPEDSL